MRKFKNGLRFGRLEITNAYHQQTNFGHWKHLCRCDCGGESLVAGVHLRTGKTQSCGCGQREQLADRNTTHGYTGTRTHRIWKGIKKRCFNENDQAYPRYGGAGIDMCQRWKDSFAAFLADMGECPDGLTIDRIDGAKGYHPGNCRWATYKKQSQNRKAKTHLPKGVQRTASGKYKAAICTDYKNRHLGTFSTLSEASEARSKAEAELWE